MIDPEGDNFDDFDDELFDVEYHDGEAIILTADQQVAYTEVMVFLTGKPRSNGDKWITLGGYAGTGKTTLMNTVVTDLICKGHRVVVSAPTHKALSVLQEKVSTDAGHVTFSTVHSLVGVRMAEGDEGELVSLYGGINTVGDYGVMIVDESSMVGTELFEKIFEESAACRVLFVGDPAQLPPVLDGDLSPAFDEMVGDQIMLTEIVRQAADNPIIALSMMIRESERRITVGDLRDFVKDLPKKKGYGVTLAAVTSSDLVRHAARRIKAGEDLRVLCYTNRRVIEINHRIHRLLYGKMDGCQFTPGQRVIAQTAFTGNPVLAPTHVYGVHTSEELTVVSVADGEWASDPSIECYEIVLATDDEVQIKVLFPADHRRLADKVSSKFNEAKRFKQASARAKYPEEAAEYALEARDANMQAWSMKKAFADLRHNFAMTVHKSQGSTFDAVVIDLSDLMGIRGGKEFNQSLYTAITRPREQVMLCRVVG